MSSIKPIFKSSEPINKETLKQSSCLITISVGQEVHEGDKFAATIDLINASFGSAILLIDDSLQRHSMALAAQEEADHFYDLAVLEGDRWLERNQKHCQNLMILKKTLRWSTWLKHSVFSLQKQVIQAEITRDPTYQTSFELTIDAFLTRYHARLLDQKNFDKQRARRLCLDCRISSDCYQPPLS